MFIGNIFFTLNYILIIILLIKYYQLKVELSIKNSFLKLKKKLKINEKKK